MGLLSLGYFMSSIFGYALIAVGFVAVVAIGSILAAFPVMLLWNWLMPAIFGLKAISFWQALGLSILCGLLFKSSSSSSSK